MATVYDVQQLRAPSRPRSAAEQASESRFFRPSMSLDESTTSLVDSQEWSGGVFRAASPQPPPEATSSFALQSYSSTGVDALWSSKMSSIDGLFANSSLAGSYFPYSPAARPSFATKSFSTGSGSDASLLSHIKTRLVDNSTPTNDPYPSAKGRQQQVHTPQQQHQPASVQSTKKEGQLSSNPNDPQNVLAKSPEIVKFLEENYERADESCSIPRCDLYTHYQQHCQETGQIITCQASFGKVIRQLFPWLKARRLGTRGKSKYHYCGIRLVRPEVPIHKLYAAQQAMSQQRMQQRLMSTASSPVSAFKKALFHSITINTSLSSPALTPQLNPCTSIHIFSFSLPVWEVSTSRPFSIGAQSELLVCHASHLSFSWLDRCEGFFCWCMHPARTPPPFTLSFLLFSLSICFPNPFSCRDSTLAQNSIDHPFNLSIALNLQAHIHSVSLDSTADSHAAGGNGTPSVHNMRPASFLTPAAHHPTTAMHAHTASATDAQQQFRRQFSNLSLPGTAHPAIHQQLHAHKLLQAEQRMQQLQFAKQQQQLQQHSALRRPGSAGDLNTGSMADFDFVGSESQSSDALTPPGGAFGEVGHGINENSNHSMSSMHLTATIPIQSYLHGPGYIFPPAADDMAEMLKMLHE